MEHLLSLSRAARLIGVTRGALQKKIQNGEMPSFDGTVKVEDLLAAYPDAQLENNIEFDRVRLIKERAFGKRVFERALPEAEVLAARVTELSTELANSQTQVRQFNVLLDRLRNRLGEIEGQCKDEMKSTMADFRAWLKDEAAAAMEPGYLNPLAVRDSILRVMAAHVRVLPSGHDFFIDGQDSILEGALRAGIPLNYGCSNGNCGLCKAKVVSGQIKKIRHHDYVISETQQSQGYVLLCSNTAMTDVEIEAPVAGSVQDIPFQQISAKVKAIEPLSHNMALLHLQTPRTSRLRFLAGQYATLQLGKSLSADLPIASCPCDDRNLHFHVRRLPGNLFSDYVFNQLKRNEVVDVEGPQGEFILQEKSPRPLYFIAFDTGFAPIKSLIEHAMSLDAAEAIHLYWIGSDVDSIYMPNMGRAWADALDNFSFSSRVTGYDLRAVSGKRETNLRAMLEEIIEGRPDLRAGDVYLAGPESAVMVAENFFLGLGLPKSRVFSSLV
ncbi:MAG: 2Fe-2S iron-sulfur cluster-binding protein [Sulfurimicrobium sp.]|nr:2Fe-2S iron-sulfur cluster-binding protein [Sulfurimicrobium sp.]